MQLLREENRPFYRMTFWLVLPIIGQNLISVSLAFFDAFMVGLLGEAEMAAVTLANIPVYVVQLFTFGFQSGSAVLISQFWGKGDRQSINRVLGIALYIAGALTLAFALALFFAPHAIMGLLTNNDQLAAIAADYGRIVGFSYFLNTLTSIYMGAHRSMENAKLGLVVLSISMVSNTFLNWVLIFGKLGFDPMGVEGAALATLLSRVLEIIIVVIYAMRNKRFPLDLNCLLRPGRALLRIFIRYSAPVVLNETLWGLGTSLYPVIMGYMANSTEILAAYTICSNVERVFTVVSFSLAAAAAVIIGKEIGAGADKEEVYQKGKILSKLTMVFGGIMMGLMLGITYLVLIPYLYPLFKLSLMAAEIATMMLVIRSLILPMNYYNAVNIVGILRGGGDVRLATAIDLSPLWLIAIPAAALTGIVFGLDIFWVFLCTFLDQPIKMALGLWRFGSKKWIRDVSKVPEKASSSCQRT